VTTFPPLHRYQSEVDDSTIDLPLRGKVYSFPIALPFEQGLKMTMLREEADRLARAQAAGIEYEAKPTSREWVDDLALHELYRELIGPEKCAEFQADGVSWQEVLHVGETLFAFHQAGEQVAMTVWASVEGDGKDSAPAGDARPPSRKPASRSRSSRSTTSRSSSKTTSPKVTKAHP
jgi:hypothetical protein